MCSGRSVFIRKIISSPSSNLGSAPQGRHSIPSGSHMWISRVVLTSSMYINIVCTLDWWKINKKSADLPTNRLNMYSLSFTICMSIVVKIIKQNLWIHPLILADLDRFKNYSHTHIHLLLYIRTSVQKLVINNAAKNTLNLREYRKSGVMLWRQVWRQTPLPPRITSAVDNVDRCTLPPLSACLHI